MYSLYMAHFFRSNLSQVGKGHEGKYYGDVAPMHIDDDRFETFFSWIHTFDARRIVNEAEVRSQFVAAFFEHLGYPKECCRHEYALPIYEPGTRNKRTTLRVDQIYFSTTEADQQTADTSLLILETKRPGESNLEGAMDQARTYAASLAPLFLAATDARRLRIVKRHCHRSEETIFDGQIQALRDRRKAYQLYHDLHFFAVQRLKQSLANTVPHPLMIDIMHTLDDHPNLQAELAARDFKPTHHRIGRRLEVRERKVAVTCILPLAFGDGECHIQFQNLLLRGLVCHLTHQQILTELLPGLDYEPQWGKRHFLQQTKNGSFEAHLGNTTVLLSEQEARDLCCCVDVIGSAYKAALVSAENTLETWNYPLVPLPDLGMHGFHLLSIQPAIWKLIKQFAYEHDRYTGDSDWHIFDKGNTQLKVIHPYMKTATLISPLYHLETDSIRLMYCFEKDDSLEYLEENEKRPWQQAVGPHGQWTAQYTAYWLTEELIPHVLGYYEEREGLDPALILRWQFSPGWNNPLPPLAQVSNPYKLALYVNQVQQWLKSCQSGRYLSSCLLHPYYVELTDLIRHSNPSEGIVRYCRKHLIAAEIALDDEQSGRRSDSTEKTQTSTLFEQAQRGAHRQQIDWLLEKLDEHGCRIATAQHEYPRVADYISCVLIALLQAKEIRYEQEELNKAKEALLPLVDLSRFEQRYVR